MILYGYILKILYIEKGLGSGHVFNLPFLSLYDVL